MWGSRENRGFDSPSATVPHQRGSLRLGGHTMSVLHVTADGFPASHLTLDYRSTNAVVSEPLSTGSPLARVAIRDNKAEA